MSLIPVVQSEGMTLEHGVICKCNRCGHRWLPENPKKLPKRCAKCKATWWNDKPGKPGRPRKDVTRKAAQKKRR